MLVTFDVSGLVQMNGETSFERPKVVVVTQVGGPFSGSVNMSPDKPAKVVFKNGTYRIHFEWENFGKPNTLYTGPTSGGGEGKG
ncbi:MAG: hypothetical protein AAB767_00315 [Patescibacteria group bacterium]